MRLNLGQIVGLLFVVLGVCGSLALFLAQGVLTSYGELSEIVNQSGRLRMLSQKIVFAAYRTVEGRPGGHDALKKGIDEFEANLAAVGRGGTYRLAVWSEASLALKVLSNDWEVYRQAAHVVLEQRHDSNQARMALGFLDGQAEVVLASAENAVTKIIAQQRQERQVAQTLVFVALLAGIAIAAASYAFIRRRVVRPALDMAAMGRRLSAGDFTARVEYRAFDEIGDLADILNRTAEATQRMIASMTSNERRLEEAERKFRTLVEESMFGVYTLDRNGMLDYVNPPMAAMFGYRQEDLQGNRSLLDLCSVENRDYLLTQILLRSPEAEGSIRLEFRGRRQDGSEFDIEGYASAIAVGERRGFIGALFDVTERKRSEQALAESERRNRMLWEATTDAVVILDNRNRIVFANPAVEALFGYRPAELIDRDVALIQPERLRTAHRRSMANFLATGTRQCDWRLLQTTALHRDGHEVPVEISFSQLSLGEERQFAAYFRDIGSRIAAEAELRLRERAMESSINGIMITDARAENHPVIYVNPAFERITGYPRDEALGRNGRFLVGDDLTQLGLGDVRAALREGRECRAELRNYRRDGSLFWNELSLAPVRDREGRTTHFVSILNDVTERKRQEEQLLRNAHFDSLTGLANRSLLLDRLEQALAAAHRYRRFMALLFVDLDRFKLINDTIGHGAGDALLRQVAGRLQECLRENDTVARIGGDEFVLLLTDVETEEAVAVIAERVLASMARPFELAGHETFVGSSIGASLYPRDGTEAETLLQCADIAMYRAKEAGRNGFQFFTAEMQQRVSERVSLESDLRRALERGEFVLHYQPQVCVASGVLRGVEALLRWNHPQRGLLPPGSFIPLAEETGLIVPLGDWVLGEACRQVSQWHQEGISGFSMAVNLSACQFRHRNLVGKVAEAVSTHGLESMQLELELTESMVMDDPQKTIGVLRELRNLGVRLSMDDFGTGYSSLSYLRQFPIDVLKIDRSFISHVATNADAAAIATAIILLARSLKLAVIAEGVEDSEQLEFLRRQGCDEAQGYLFSRPVPADRFAVMIQSNEIPTEKALARTEPDKVGTLIKLQKESIAP